jgi:hypothetical protein
MARVFPFALLVAAAFAQTAPPPAAKPPAEVDQTLRARVNEFYTLLKNHEYRKAEGLVAEDTKDYYYDGSKPEVSNFEILAVEWTDRFTRAKVTTQCSQMLVVPGFPASEVKLRVPTTWKLENGNWYVFVDQSKQLSPVGLPLKPPSGTASGAASGPPPAGIPREIPTTTDFVLGKLQADKQTVHLAPGTSEQVTLTNGSAGFMQLQLGYPLAGVEAKLDRANLNQGEKAILTLQAGKEPKPGIYSLRVMPTQEVIDIQVQVK